MFTVFDFVLSSCLKKINKLQAGQVKLKCVVMLEDFFLQTNEVSLERVGGQTIASDDSVDNDLGGKGKGRGCS